MHTARGSPPHTLPPTHTRPCRRLRLRSTRWTRPRWESSSRLGRPPRRSCRRVWCPRACGWEVGGGRGGGGGVGCRTAAPPTVDWPALLHGAPHALPPRSTPTHAHTRRCWPPAWCCAQRLAPPRATSPGTPARSSWATWMPSCAPSSLLTRTTCQVCVCVGGGGAQGDSREGGVGCEGSAVLQ